MGRSSPFILTSPSMTGVPSGSPCWSTNRITGGGLSREDTRPKRFEKCSSPSREYWSSRVFRKSVMAVVDL